ncbi:conserved hypothetical protein [Pseudomonas sp. P14-2025]
MKVRISPPTPELSVVAKSSRAPRPAGIRNEGFPRCAALLYATAFTLNDTGVPDAARFRCLEQGLFSLSQK